jgi:hypothetical protein
MMMYCTAVIIETLTTHAQGQPLSALNRPGRLGSEGFWVKDYEPEREGGGGRMLLNTRISAKISFWMQTSPGPETLFQVRKIANVS